MAWRSEDPSRHQILGADIWTLSIDGDRKPRTFIATPYNESNPIFSPDGRWIAYESDETGRTEVFVAAFPGPGRKWQVSNGGGQRPAWTRGGRELLYRNSAVIMTASIETTPAFQPSVARELLRLPVRTDDYAASPDGERFLVIRRENQDLVAPELHVVLEWFSELTRLLPVAR